MANVTNLTLLPILNSYQKPFNSGVCRIGLISNLAFNQLMIQPFMSLTECELCFAPANHSGFLCSPCYQELTQAKHACLFCAEPIKRMGVCHRCLLKPPPTDSVFCSYLYLPPLSLWIKSFKDQQQLNQLPRLLWLMQSNAPNLEHINAIVYIPSEGLKLFKRGFNPAELIARKLADTYNLPVLSKALIKKTAKDQRLLGRTERIKNSQQSIQAGKLNLSNKYILLVEDVVTTGATANAAALALKQQGATYVQVWALARTANYSQ